jgi:hypothetical protein
VVPSSEDKWQQARLMPVTGITGADEEERRGTSVLLSVLGAVQEFGRAITTRMGAPVGPMETFIECEFKSCRPDGAIRVRGRGNKMWTALVEVKTRRNSLQLAQVETYLDVARENGYDAVVTISTELPDVPGGHPLAVDKRKSKKVSLHHISWSEIHTEALIERDNHSVSDPDQAWILSEFIRYLESPKSGALEFDDMGPSWVAVREAAARSTLRVNDPGAAQVVGRFSQLVSYAGMRLSQHLGVVVKPVLSRRDQDQAVLRAQQQLSEFVTSGRLSGSLLVPNAVGPLQITADLRANRVECSVAIEPAKKARPSTRVTWVTNQLRDPPKDLTIQARVAHHDNGPSFLIDKVIEDPEILVEQPKVDIRQFTLTLNKSAGNKRGRGRGAFIDSVLELVDEFYEQVVQDLKPAVPPAPRVKSKPGASTDEVLVSVTDLPSQDDGDVWVPTPGSTSVEQNLDRPALSPGLGGDR